MSTSVAAAIETTRLEGLSRALHYVALARPRIAVLVLAAVAVGAWTAGPQYVIGWVLIHTLAGTALVAASASALNQWLERDLDRRMHRTAARPLPAARLSAVEALAFGVAAVATGLAYLAWKVNLTTAAIASATWFLYVAVYTPLKTRTAQNTAIGAVAGALPVLIGWSSTGAPMNLTTAALTTVLYLWQFPHFGAIAWLYRQDYDRAGMKMLSVVDPSGRRLSRQAIVTALCLIPVGVSPALECADPRLYAVWALALGLGYLAVTWMFAQRPDRVGAQRLLTVSLVYLPAQLALVMMVPLS